MNAAVRLFTRPTQSFWGLLAILSVITFAVQDDGTLVLAGTDIALRSPTGPETRGDPVPDAIGPVERVVLAG